jgi:flavin reductase (DIM6/NTAB) family NADH-FMN oxidoreductase RutF
MISNGMYVVTSRSGDKYGGATVTWLSQASFKPPLIMAAIRPDSNVFDCLTESGSALVHMLGADQQEIARRFLSTTDVANGMMNGVPFSPGPEGMPVLGDMPAHVVCRVVQIINDRGDHALVLLEVVDAVVHRDTPPLLVADSPWTYGG